MVDVCRYCRLSTLSHVLLISVIVAGCTGLGTEVEAPTGPAPAATTAASKTRHVIQRGSITGTIRAAGRLASGAEQPLAFATSGKLRALHVAVGDQVKAGDLLAELDGADATRKLDDATLSYELAGIRLQQARSKTVGDQDVLVARTNVDRADADLRRATARLAQLQAGPTAADLRAAELAILTAELARDDAAGKLETARRGPKADALAAARGAVERTRLGLAAAEAALGVAEAERAAAGTLAARGLSPEAVGLANARAGYEKARLDYEAKTAPLPTPVPDPLRLETLRADVLAAEAAVEAGRAALIHAEYEQSARRAPGVPAPINRVPSAKTALEKADLDLELARRRLELARTGKLPGDANGTPARSAAANAAEVAAAKAAMEAAKRTLDQAEVAVDAATKRGTAPSPQEMAVAEARLANDLAQQALARLEAGAPDEEIAPLERATVLAQASYEAAVARLEGLRAPPEREVREAQEAVDRATADLQLARAEYATRQSEIPGRRTDLALDLKAIERQVESASRAVAEARRALNATRLVAPAAGTVISLEKKVRESIEDGQTVVVLADLSDLLVNANVSESEAAALVTGQPATIVIPSLTGVQLPATVAEVGATPLLQDGLTAIRVTLRLQEKAPPGVRPGLPNEVVFEDVTRDATLLLPKAAVRTVGARRTAIIVDRDREREVEIRTGIISTDGERVEVLAGLREGDAILLPPAA